MPSPLTSPNCKMGILIPHSQEREDWMYNMVYIVTAQLNATAFTILFQLYCMFWEN